MKDSHNRALTDRLNISLGFPGVLTDKLNTEGQVISPFHTARAYKKEGDKLLAGYIELEGIMFVK